VSLRAGWFTYNTKTGRTSVNPPGPGSVWVDTRNPAHRPRPARPAASAPPTPDLRAFARAHIVCKTCQAELGDVCRTGADRHPTTMHKTRTDAASLVMQYGTDGAAVATTAPPVSTPAPAGASVWATFRRIFGIAGIVALVVVSGTHGWIGW
jgi:hypothetical protein